MIRLPAGRFVTAFWPKSKKARCKTRFAAEQVPRTLQDVDFAVANGNYAVEAGILDKVLVTEDASSEGAQTYPNVIAVREGDEDREDIQALVAALKSEETRAFIEETYGASVVPVE